ncbi:MAG: hypothetical protein WCI47_00990 [bacterium]
MKKNKQWFRARERNWGWYPESWQAWMIIMIWVIVLAGVTAALNLRFDFGWLASVLSIIFGFTSFGILVMIAQKTSGRADNSVVDNDRFDSK